MPNMIRFIGGDAQWLGSPTAEEIGGKALSLVRMSKLGLNVPPAMVIPCSMTFDYLDGPQTTLANLKSQVEEGMKWIEKQVGRKCLFSVRSGAPVSMPGMMDTILNVGLCNETFKEIEALLGTKTTVDCHKRLAEMYGKTVLNVSNEVYNQPVDMWHKLIPALGELDTMKPIDQVMECVAAVFRSWNSPRAIEYRKINGLSDTMGTAVTIQAMVYGNLNDKSCSGVLFSKCPATGEDKLVGEYVVNGQGEDVVSGTVTPKSIYDMEQPLFNELGLVAVKLEDEWKDAVDVEFTVEDGKLYILQCRKAKRTDRAAVKIATDMLNSKMITVDDLGKYLTRKQVLKSAATAIRSTGSAQLLGKGLPAGGGVGRGKVVTTVDAAVNCTEPCVLVRHETLPDDIAGMNKAVAILTMTGGATSHAAVVARAMNKPCVTAFQGMTVEQFGLNDTLVVNGDTGEVWLDDGSIVLSEGSEQGILDLATEIAKSMKVPLTSTKALPGCRTVVPVADLLDDDQAITELLNDMKKDSFDLVVDLTPALTDAPNEDMEVWGFAKSAMISRKEMEVHAKLAKALKGKVGKNVKVIATALEGTGVATVKVAKTVEELFSGALVTPSNDLLAMIGSTGFMAQLVDKFGTPNLFARPKTAHELILSVIGL